MAESSVPPTNANEAAQQAGGAQTSVFKIKADRFLKKLPRGLHKEYEGVLNAALAEGLAAGHSLMVQSDDVKEKLAAQERELASLRNLDLYSYGMLWPDQVADIALEHGLAITEEKAAGVAHTVARGHVAGEAERARICAEVLAELGIGANDNSDEEGL